MPSDGNGNYTLPASYEATTGGPITVSQHNPPLEDIAAGLTARLMRSGAGGMIGNLPMGGNRIVNLADGSSSTDAATKQQVDAVSQQVDAVSQKLADPWRFYAVGEPVALMSDVAGVSLPPTDKDYRYVLLTAGQTGGGQYNEGILTSESVSGDAPLVVATAQVNLPASPLHGQTIRLINSTREFLRPGASGTTQDSQNLAHEHDIGRTQVNAAGAPISAVIDRFIADANDDDEQTSISGGDEARPRNIGVTYVMRVL